MKFCLRRATRAPHFGLGVALYAGQHYPARAAGWSGVPANALLGAATALLALALIWLLRHERAQRRRNLTLQRQLTVETTLRINAQLAVLTTHAALTKLVARQAVIRDNERRRIGRDIHDDLGQNLLALKIDISLMQLSTHDSHPLLHLKLEQIARHVELTMRSLRGIVLDLHPIGLEAGLRAGLERQLHEFSRLNGISCDLSADSGLYAMTGGLDAIVFRAVQEALSNIARHARANRVAVALVVQNGVLSITVRDDGVGIAPDQPWRGCGLVGIRERVTAVGGALCVASQPGDGTTITLQIPLPGAPARPTVLAPLARAVAQ
jgi:signal transduction histidine kinase